MVEFANPLASLSQGISSGVNMGLQLDQARKQRKAQEWENDFRIISSGLNLAQTKGMSPESQAKILNESVAPAWKKWTGHDFPAINPADSESMESIRPLIKNLNNLGKSASEGKIDWGTAFTEANSQLANYHVNARRMGEVSDREKAATEAAMAPIKSGYEVGQAAKKTAASQAKTPDEVMKEMFEINKSVVGMQQLDQNTANLLAIAPEAAQQLVGARLSPDQLGQIKGMASARMRTLNSMLPAEQRLAEISPEEYQKLVAAGVTPEEISRRSFVVPGR